MPRDDTTDAITVGHLIESLETLDPALPVFIQQDGGDYDWMPAMGVSVDDLHMRDDDRETDDDPPTIKALCIGYE